MNECKKVVFLGDTIVGPEPLGIQRFTVEILKELDKLELPYKVEVLIPNIDNCSLKLKNIKIIRYGKRGRTGFLWRQFDFPHYINKEKAISVDFTLGLTFHGSDVVCLHDCIHENYPDDFIGLKAKIKRLSYLIRAKRNVKKARKIITVSETSKKELVKFYRIPENKIAVIYNAWQHIERIEPDDSILKKFNIHAGEFFFSLGSQLPHKNFKWILEAAKQNPKETFVVTGSNHVRKNNDHYEGTNNIIFTGFLSDGEIKSLMSNCKCFIFPSLYEGFGIPPLEAMSVGRKCIISNMRSLPEVYGNSVWYIDPYEYNDINIERIMTENIDDNSIVLRKFSWRSSAQKLNEVLEKFAKGETI